MDSRDGFGVLLGSVILSVVLFLLFQVQRGEALPTWERMEIGQSLEGLPIHCLERGPGPGGILFIASIHGSEGAGTPLMQAFAEHLRRQPTLARDRRILIVPVANPDGYGLKGRRNRNGVDLNRDFPADNRRNRQRYGHRALSEPESRALHALIDAKQPDVIVSIHQPVTCVDYDGPESAKVLASRMAEACNLPLRKLGSRPGSLGAYFGETLGRPIITLELPPLTPQDPAKLYGRYGDALWEAVRFQEEVASTKQDH